ncbi:MAG TPA: hypothetical protein HA360_01130 [Nanoarchaeota archaeon]|nr:hypothetical protein [Candidatus Woesearchaeota archaeon]HIH15092.1 hypothetical protein [Nanoarchaeota archaeon]HIH58747.1 hypothetical protein [Nanoarchaeota archaeon]HII13654.1 hypothetical protein [Nanoarchaeota archaeon]HIJ04865.1 hypothetical protein [Nanoarchaeota archaeon]
MLKNIDRLLDHILEDYNKWGICLQKRPKLHVVEERTQSNFNYGSYVHAAVILNPNQKIKRDYDMMYRIAKVVYEGTGVSKEKIQEEIHQKIKEALKKSEKYMDQQGDIILYPDFFSESGKITADITLAHEIWHIVEDGRNLITNSIWSREGSATYASYRLLEVVHANTDQPFRGRPFSHFAHPIHGLYDACALITSKYVEQEQNPFQALLLPSIRAKIEAECEQELFKRIREFYVTKPLEEDSKDLL